MIIMDHWYWNFFLLNLLILSNISSSLSSDNNGTCFNYNESDLNKIEDGLHGQSYRLFATKTTYLTARQEIRKLFNNKWPTEINNCNPIYLYFLNRHSIRYPSAKEIKLMNLVLDSFRNELINSGKLSYRLFIYLVTWRSRMVENDDNHVSDSGKQQTAQTAKIFYRYFPTLLDIDKTNFQVGISTKIRTEETADAFIDSLIEEQLYKKPQSNAKEIKQTKFKKVKQDVLMSHKLCKSLIKSKGSTIPKSHEYDVLVDSPAVRKMLKTFSQRLGLSYTISIEYFILIYKACSYETAIFGFSPWCHLFTKSELKSIEYLLDVEEYFDAYEVGPHRKMACQVIGDLQQKLHSMIEQNSGSNATLYFSHENLLSKVLSYFGLFNKFPKNHHIDGDKLCIPEDREWRSSLIVPFGTNFAAVLYKCPINNNDGSDNKSNSSFKIFTLVNEIPVIVRGCDNSLCDIDKFFNEFQSDQIECDLEEIFFFGTMERKAIFCDIYNETISTNHRLSSRTIKIKYGILRGLIVNLPEKNLQPVEVFLGIPYASPPIGKLRFMPPVTPAIWSGVKISNVHGPVCPQKLPDLRNETISLQKMTRGRWKILNKLQTMLKNQSEDCLYLNIYIPLGLNKGTNHHHHNNHRLPVLVFIHGESYDWNSGSAYDGSILASQSNIVVVTINFRLGILGFFPSLGGTARGNFGLMDQVAALHWIQENIREFNGDERNVTIIGYGHGAACVNFLMLSPMARGLFHRAIMISGSALSPWAIASDAIFHARNLAKILGCYGKNDSDNHNNSNNNNNNNIHQKDEILECLRQKPVQDILSVDLKIPTHLTAFGPIIDGIVIPGHPQTLMTKHNSIFSSYELLFGLVKTESYNLFSMYDERHGLDMSRRDRLLRTLIRNLFNYHLQEIFLTIVNEYTDWSRPFLHPISLFDSVVDIFSDALIVAPTIRTGLLHSKQSSKTYFFTFEHQTENGDYPTRLGCIHGQDMAYLFGAPLLNGVQFSWFSRNYTRAEIALSKTYIDYLTNFIKTGNPNNNGSSTLKSNNNNNLNAQDSNSWPPYEEVQQKYIAFDLKTTIQNHYLAHRLSYWFNLLPQLHKPGNTDSKDHHLLESHNNIQTYDGIVRYGSLSAPISFNTYFSSENIFMPNVSMIHLNNQSTYTNIFIDSQQLENNINNNNDSYYDGESNEGSALDLVHNLKSSINSDQNNSSFSMIVQSNNLYTWLSLIIAIGCSLLILNVLVFAGFYYHKDRNRLETKLMRQQYQEPQIKNKNNNNNNSKHNAAKELTKELNRNIPLFRINSITDDYNRQNSTTTTTQ